MILGMLNCLALPVVLALAYSAAVQRQSSVVLVTGLSIVTGPLIVLAGVKMRALEARGLAMAGSILALIPLTPAGVLGTVPGIWALSVLTRPRVVAAFRRVSAESALEFGLPPSMPIDSAIAGGTRYGAPLEK
jgi:hypothetical protein